MAGIPPDTLDTPRPSPLRRNAGIALLVLSSASILASLASAVGRDDRVAPQQADSYWDRVRGTHFNTFRRPIGTPADLHAVDAWPDSQRVWVGGSGGVLALSENDGQSIEPAQILSAQGTRPTLFTDTVDVRPAPGFSATILDLHFETVVHGYAVDDLGGILETWTRGRTWARYPSQGGLPLRTVAAVRPDHLTGNFVPVPSQETQGFPELQAQAAQRRFVAAHWFNENAALGIGGDSLLLGISGPAGTWSPVPLPPSSGDPQGPVRAVALARLDLASALVAVELPQLRTRILRGRFAGTGWSWTVVSEPGFKVAALRADGPNRVWALTAGDSRVRLSTDGGATWTESSLPHGLDLRDLVFRDSVRGWAVGDHGTILRSSDGGRRWSALSGAGDRLEAVRFVDRRQGWAVGSWGTVLYTTSGGNRWAGRSGATRTHLRDLAVLSAREVVVVGDRLTVLRTEDGGLTWEPPLITYQTAARGAANIRAVHFATARMGWAVADSGTILQSGDGGQTWRVSGLSTRENLTDVFFATPDRGWITTAAGRIYATANGGISWALEREGAAPLASIHGAGGAVWAVGARGTILIRGAQGAWTAVQTPVPAELTSVLLTSRDNGWAAGSSGALFRTTDGGRTWQLADSRTRSDLLGLASRTDGRVWAVGTSGAILRRDPGPAGWTEVATTRVWRPGALLWLGLLGFVVGIGLIRSAPVEPRVDDQLIDAVLVSDEPLQPGDPGTEQLVPYARTIARFLLNRSTRPPLTMAITGQWGAGKSSLMNLIRGEIQAYGRQPVQFNAWQHQKEDHLLAAFLETIRNEGLPTLFSTPGRFVQFRWRLLWTRLGAHRPAATAAVIFLILCLTFVGFAWYAGWPDVLVRGFNGCKTLNACPRDLWQWMLGNVVAAVFGGAFLVSLAQSIRSFGALPTSVFAKLGEMLRIKPAALETSVRQRFAAELQEVSQALGPDHPLIVFVDDLDRCRPRHILDVLEAIHFLVNVGRCIVVIGMDWERVLRSVALSFGADAEAIWLPEDSEANAGAPLPRRALREVSEKEVSNQKQVDYAKQYLDKLITVTIPLPPAQMEDYAGYLRNATMSSAPRPRRLVPTSFRGPLFAAIALFALLLWGLRSLTDSPAPPARTNAIATFAAPIQAPSDTAAIGDTLAAPVPERRVLPIFPQVRATNNGWFLTLLGVVSLLALLLLLVFRSRRRPEVIRDSRPFRDAFRLWAPYLSQKYSTPRALKKFVTRVRYYAMASAINAGPEPPRLIRGSRAGAPADRPSVPDQLLVALASLHECDPETFMKDQTYRRFAQTVGDTLKLDPNARASMGLPETLTTEWREWFDKIVEGLRIQSPGTQQDVSVTGIGSGTGPSP